jgi:DNA modification methylase
VALAEKNFALHRQKWETLGSPMPRIIQGDSRRFAELVDAAITSPPFSEPGRQPVGNCPSTRPVRSKRRDHGIDDKTEYGWSEGQIGNLKIGAVDSVVTSPPYAANEKSDHLMSEDGKNRQREDRRGFRQGRGCFRGSETYGEEEGQIGRLREGSVDAAITSPPYAACPVPASVSQPGGRQGVRSTYKEAGAADTQDYYGAEPGQIGALPAGTVDACVTSPPWENQEPSHAQGDEAFAAQKQKTGGCEFLDAEYGKTDGQIGEAAGETYWQAMSAVYSQVRQAVKPGGIVAIVVKDYVKNGQRVPLCDQTCQLLEHLGFTVFERCRAWLTKVTEHADLFDGTTTTKKSRKSFFRRLAEKKGSPAIDWEEVLWLH